MYIIKLLIKTLPHTFRSLTFLVVNQINNKHNVDQMKNGYEKKCNT